MVNKTLKNAFYTILGLAGLGYVEANAATAPKAIQIKGDDVVSIGTHDTKEGSCPYVAISKIALDDKINIAEGNINLNVAPCMTLDEAKSKNPGVDIEAIATKGDEWVWLLNMNNQQYTVAGKGEKVSEAVQTNSSTFKTMNGAIVNGEKKSIEFPQINTTPAVKELSPAEKNKLFEEFLSTHKGWIKVSGVDVPFYNLGAEIINNKVYAVIDLPGIDRQLPGANKGISLGDQIGYQKFFDQLTGLGSIEGKDEAEANAIKERIKNIFSAHYNASLEFRKISQKQDFRWKPENFNPIFREGGLYAIQIVSDDEALMRQLRKEKIEDNRGEKGMLIMQKMNDVNDYAVWPAFGNKLNRNYVRFRVPIEELKPEIMGVISKITPSAPGAPRPRELTLEEKCALKLEPPQKCGTAPEGVPTVAEMPGAATETVMPESVTSPVVALLKGIGNNIGLKVLGGFVYEAQDIKSNSDGTVTRSEYDGVLPVLDLEGVLKVPVKGIYLIGRGGAVWKWNGYTEVSNADLFDKSASKWNVGGGLGFDFGPADVSMEGRYAAESADKSLADGKLSADKRTELDGFGISGRALIDSKLPVTLIFDYSNLSGDETMESALDLTELGGRVERNVADYGISKESFEGGIKLGIPHKNNILDLMLAYQHMRTVDNNSNSGSRIEKEERQQSLNVGAAYSIKIPGGDFRILIVGTPFGSTYDNERSIDEKYDRGVRFEAGLRFGGDGRKYLSE